MVELEWRAERGKEGERAQSGGEEGKGVEKVAPAATSSSTALQKALLLLDIVVALSRKSATTKEGPLVVAAHKNRALLSFAFLGSTKYRCRRGVIEKYHTTF